ncbi:triose-phosphate isomerase [Methanoplanus sp. FWC-SCC4]|uniref:Triosephosphate isomerase n=1 Tax=Methanochimaera problematica TaxID=2609417 RepID=A0AA97FAV5_9EURY|nr:triose-phosphate isomerase [Methanoplanus sp. FWC-SCC4]WOF15594.1 triose-phosphate isomerase [Methanoplanus sp. FWC-SCC4]
MPEKFPTIIINFKAYKEGYGHRAHSIAQAALNVSMESGVLIGIAPGYMDIHPMSNHYNLPVYAQHIDAINPGAHTGHILAGAVREAGATGTLINHSERRLTLADISGSVKAAKEANLQTIVCTNDILTSAAAASFSPDFIAIEPPELIGSGISVATADPEIIENSVTAVKEKNSSIRVLAGAGISTGECVKRAIELGADGVLLASGVVKADDPEKVLRSLVSKI